MIKFEKWQGLGNDFIILEENIITPTLAKELCNRQFGIGADGIFAPVSSKIADIGWNFYNSDGTIAQMCGNGIRCFAKYVYFKGLVKSKKFTVETLAGIITPTITDDNDVIVDMGEPIIEPTEIPIKADDFLNVKVQGYDAVAVSMGNPHCVIYTKEDSECLAKTVGKSIEFDPIFPEKTNVEFVNIISKNKVKMNVWERGCGITLACGTGACATVVAGYKKGLIERSAEVVLPGGSLFIDYKEDNHVYMKGSATLVFKGEYQ